MTSASTTLESLVPPYEMCLKIPKGEFGRSALVWKRVTHIVCTLPRHEYVVRPRACIGCKDGDNDVVMAPAPTLAELLQAAAERSENGECIACFVDMKRHADGVTADPEAALDFWFEQKGIEL